MIRNKRKDARHLQGLLIILFINIPTLFFAQNTEDIHGSGLGISDQYGSVPAPEEVIGHKIGTSHSEPHQVLDYFRVVSATSELVTLEEYGRTYEGRPLIRAIVTSESNHARLEEIRLANLLLSEQPDRVSDAELATMPAVVYLGYSIHGDEASGTEAAILLLHHLATNNGTTVENILKNVIVIIDPMMNPDGRVRFTTWVNQNRGAVAGTDPQDREHNMPWPGGRTNHYWFDLNRDWLPVQHPSSVGRLKGFYHWRPQLLSDFHELRADGTYYFSPGIPSRNNPNISQIVNELTVEMSLYHSRALDSIGSLYYTKEIFDNFYFGMGSVYPGIVGGVGVLMEQATSMSLERETKNGIIRYPFTINNHFTTSLSTLDAVLHMREKLLRHQRDFYSQSPKTARENPVKGYVIDSKRDLTRVQAFLQLMKTHQIRVHELKSDFITKNTTYRVGSAYIVPSDQPQTRLLKSLMETTKEFTDSLFYTLSTWTMPLAYGLDYEELRENVTAYVGNEVNDVNFSGGSLIGGRSKYGYLLAWDRYFAPRALYKLQKAGIQTRLMLKPFSINLGGKLHDFDRGTIFIPLVQSDVSPENIHTLIERIVKDEFVLVYAAETGMTTTGPDFGSYYDAHDLEMPRVSIVTGSGISAQMAGELWHLLNERFQMQVSLVNIEDVNDVDLTRYNTLILAPGSYSELSTEKIQNWIRGGGRLIGIRDAADWIVSKELIKLDRKSFNSDSLFASTSFENLVPRKGAQTIGGSIFQVQLDVTHPLAFGYGEFHPVFHGGNTFYKPSNVPGTNVATYTNDPLLSGYISKEMIEQVKGSAAIVAQPYGSGSVILLMDNPNFWAFWYGTNKMLLNAIFFGGAL